jgi:hypothetical protein
MTNLRDALLVAIPLAIILIVITSAMNRKAGCLTALLAGGGIIMLILWNSL